MGFNRKFDNSKIEKTVSYDHGNLLLRAFTHSQRSFLMVTLYGPNEDRPDFYEDVRKAIVKFVEMNPVDYLIVHGDFNLTLNPEIDTSGYHRVNNVCATEKLKLIAAELDLHDAWRTLHPHDRRFTYRQRNSTTLIENGLPAFKQARLDFILVSGNLLPFVKSTEINFAHRTDHSAVTLKIDFLKFRSGPGVWRFNSSLLRFQDFMDRCNNEIKNVQREYLCLPYSRTFFENLSQNERQMLHYQIEDGLLFEMILMTCRNVSISYAAHRKKETNRREDELVAELEAAEKDFSETEDPEAVDHMQLLKTELTQIREGKIRGAQVRSRAKWAAEGERPTSYFCGLETRNFTEKFIPCLRTGNGLVSDQKDILRETATHFRGLFSAGEKDITNTMAEFLEEAIGDVTQLSESESHTLEREITYEEVTYYIQKKLKTGKSPGSTGFTNEFYKAFWPQVG